MCRHLSFWARGCPAILRKGFTIYDRNRFYYLLTNPSKPDRLSSMKSSSNIPSSLRNGICLLRALLGSGGTTILSILIIYNTNISYSQIAHLAVPLELIPQPLKVRISPTNAGLLHTEDRQICLQITESIIQINLSVSPLTLSRTS